MTAAVGDGAGGALAEGPGASGRGAPGARWAWPILLASAVLEAVWANALSASAGFTVLALGRNAELVAALAAECGAVPLIADVRDTAAIMAGIGDHAIDILVNNAGIGYFGSVEESEVRLTSS